jgi:hypothetical protein
MSSTFTGGPNRTKFINFVVTAPDANRLIDVPMLIARTSIKGEVNIGSVAELTSTISKKADEQKAKIAHLTIYAHANPTGVKIGEDWISLDTIKNFESDLKTLKPFFIPKVSFVHFASCKLGKSSQLIAKFAELWGGPTVRAYTETQYPEDEWPLGTGSYHTCELGLCTFTAAKK